MLRILQVIQIAGAVAMLIGAFMAWINWLESLGDSGVMAFFGYPRNPVDRGSRYYLIAFSLLTGGFSIFFSSIVVELIVLN